MTIPILTLGGLGTTSLSLDGPDTATVNVASDEFTVRIASGLGVGSVRVTPDDGGAGGSFSVAYVTLSDGSRSATFTYTPVAAGVVEISVSNDGGLDDPAPIILEVTRAPIIMLRPGAWRAGGRR